MKVAKVTKVFRNENSQVVRIPEEFHVDEEELLIQKIGDTLMLSPGNDPWRLFKKSLSEFSEDFFPDGRNQPDMQEREPVFPSVK